MEIITKNATETESIGEQVGSGLKGGEILLLNGDLGTGKTTFVQGLARGLGIKTAITSPTFILMRSYQIPQKQGRDVKTLYHVDLYRLEQNVDTEIQNLGILDLWGHSNTIFVIEWADRLTHIPHEKENSIQEISFLVEESDIHRITIQSRS